MFKTVSMHFLSPTLPRKLNYNHFVFLNFPLFCNMRTVLSIIIFSFSIVFLLGNFSRLSAVFRFKRQLGFYLLQEFIPTVLIVALSWVGFWIDERSVPARVSLGITTVLALTTLMFGIQASLPRVGHVKAIDVFLMGSFIFVFATLIEYAIICHLLSIHQTTSEVSDTFHQVFERKQVELQVNVLQFFDLLLVLFSKRVPTGFFNPVIPTQMIALSLYFDSYFGRTVAEPSLMVTSKQRPLSSDPKVAGVERFNCITSRV